ncbi:hypothetical protein MTO96_022153 [Rhipicephalus appendiculatus]
MEVSQVTAPTLKTQIQDLEEGHEYLVRIYAWNEVGVSEPLETPEGTKIVRPPGVVVPPSAPVGPLVIEEVTENSVRLSWKPPLNDGGDAVANYIVEYRDVSAAEIAKFSLRTPDARTRFTVEDLKCRHFYVFRVSAENQAGVGDALVDKKPVRVQAAPKKPPAPDPPVVVVHPTMPDACIVTWAPPVRRGDPNLVPGIEYSFRVSAENECGMGKWSKPSEPIVITRKVASMTAPEFTKLLSDVNVLVDNDACFTCQYKGGQELFESPRADIETSLASSTLRLKQVRLEDKGKIECQALNNAGLKTTSAKLTVLAPPKLISSPAYKDGLMFDSGETLRVKLSYTGHPPPTFVWKRNGQPLTFDDPNCSVTLDSEDQTILFKIVDADCNHRGTYSLEALNEHGSDVFSVDIMITGEPDPPSLPPEITSVDWTSCTLAWKPTDNDGGSPVSSYVVEKRLMDNELWLKATTTHHEHCTVYGLEEGAKYAFRLRAVTVYGTSKPGPSTEPVSLPRLDSRGDTLATEIESTEQTEAIATEQELGSIEEDVTLTVTKYDSDDQRSSLDVDEFLNEDAAVSEVVSQVTAPLAPSELSDYETLVPSSTVKVESGEVSEIDNDTLAKRASLETSDVAVCKAVPIAEAVVAATKEEPLLEAPLLPERKEAVALRIREHSYEVIPYAGDDVFDLSLEEQRYEQATHGYIPLTVSCTVTVLTWQNADDVPAVKRRADTEQPLGIHLVPHTFHLVVFSPPLLLDQTHEVSAPHPPEGIAVRVVTLAQWNMYRNLLPESSFLIIDVSEPLLVLAPPLALESTSFFVDPDRRLPIVCRFTLSERLPLAVNYIIDTLLTESNLRRLQHPSRACCSIEYIEAVPSPMAIITTVKPTEPVPKIVTPQASPELLLERPIYEKRRELLSASPADSGVDTSFGYQRPIVRSTKPQAGEYDEEFYMHDTLYYKKAARVKEFDVRTRRSYSRRITSLSRSIEHDYSIKRTNIDRLESRISSEMSSLERDLELLRSMQSMLRRELKTRERPSGDQNGGKEGTNGRKADATSDSSATSRVRPYPESGSRGYMSRRLSRSDSSDSEEPQPVKPRAKQQPKGEAPRFVTRLDNRIAPSGYRIKLHCTVTGDPMPQVTWLKNGIKVTPDIRHMEITVTDFGMCSLEIYNVKPDDTAEYTCHAVNAYGDATTSAYLRVTGERDETPEEPRFESCAPDLSVRPGGKAVFSWRATGSPTPTLKVMKDSRPLRTNLTTDVIISKDGVCRVCIAKVTPEDAGVFTCTAENDSGTAVSTSILRIAGQEDSSDEFQEERRRLEEMHMKDKRQSAAAVERELTPSRPRYELPPEEDKEEYYKPRRHFKTYGMLGLNYLEDVPRTTHEPFSVPGPPLDPVVTETGPTSATLVWTKPIYNGGSPITGYRIQCREVPSKQWRDKTTSRICLCDIFGLKPQTEYVFQVSAGNKNGWGQPTIAVPELKNWRWRQHEHSRLATPCGCAGIVPLRRIPFEDAAVTGCFERGVADSTLCCPLLILVLMAGNVHGWATLKKLLVARLLSGPRVIAVPIPVPIHHYHYPPTNVWDTPPIPKSPGVTEITDLSHLHALFDAPADTPAKLTQEHAGGVDVVDYSAAAEALSSASADKSSKASSTQSLPTYSERVSPKRPTYNPYRSTTYYGAETPSRYYTSSASSPYASKSYATVDYDSYASKLMSKAARQPYGPRYLDEADFPANMAALRQFMKDHHIKSLEPTWNRQQTSYSQTESSSKWPSVVAAATKAAADLPASLYKGYGWTSYPTHSYNKAAYPTHSYDTSYPTHSYDKSYPMTSYDKSYPMPSYVKSYPTQSYDKTYPTHSYDKTYPTHSYGKKDEDKGGATKQYESTDPFDWAQYVASAYKAATEKSSSSQSSAAARYDTMSQSGDSDAETTTTESSPGSPTYQGNTKKESPSTLASVTSTTSKTPTELQAPDPPSVTTLSSGSPRSSKKV